MDVVNLSSLAPRAGDVASRAEDFAPRLTRGLGLLAEGWHYACAAQVSVWDFAIELPRLRQLKLSHNDLRFLVLQGAVEHALELTLSGDNQRSFRPATGLVFARRTCFVLSTEGASLTGASSGEDFAQPKLLHESPAPPIEIDAATPCLKPTLPVSPTMSDSRPRWDQHRRELSVGCILVKRFTLPAPRVESVLAAFEEQHWPPDLDNPLPAFGQASRCLQQTLDELNGHLRRALLRFHAVEGDRTIAWQLTDEREC